MVAWFVLILIAIALEAISYIMRPKPKQSKPEAAKDLEEPVAEAGMPIPIVFGTITVKGVNVLGYMDKAMKTYKVNA